MKRCIKCLVDKTLVSFWKNKRMRDGLLSICIPCSKLYMENYRAKNAAILQIKNVSYKRRHAARVNVERRERYKTGRFEIRQRARATRRLRLEHYRERDRYWSANNKEKRKQYTAKYRSRNIERHKAWVKNWKAANKEHVAAYQRGWLKSHPEQTRQYQRNRKAWKNSSPGKITIPEWLDICSQYGGKCLRCGSERITMDHIVPLSAGGAHSKENVQPLCASCNASKGRKTIDYRQSSRRAEMGMR